MGKYVPDHVLDRIRQASDIVALVRETLPLKKSGTGYKALCPFHREKTPSFRVNPEKQIFKCFGCGVGGNVFTYVMKTDGVSFVEAVRILAERVRIDLPADALQGASSGEKSQLYEVNTWAADTFHRWLVEHTAGKAAIGYLKDRGVSQEMVKEFRLGFSPEGWDSLLKAGKRKGYSLALMAKAGLLSHSERSESLYDRFRNRLMFPIRDTQNRIIGFGARALDDSEPKYLNTPETPLFYKGRVLYGIYRARSALREKRKAIVVEGYMDAIMAHQFGIPWTVAVLGTALTRDHVRLLRRYVDEAVLVFDADNAGQSPASRSVDAFAAEELTARVVTLPDELDPDEFLRRHGVQVFLDRMDKAVEGVSFKLERALSALPKDAEESPLRMARALDDVLATVVLIPNAVAQSLEIRKIAEGTGLPEHIIRQRVDHLAAGHQAWSEEPSPAPAVASGRDIERELLEVMLTYPETVPMVRTGLDENRLRDAHVRTLIHRFLQLAASAETVGPAELLARTQEEPLRKIIEEIIGKERVSAKDPQAWSRELLDEIEARTLLEAGRELHRKVFRDETASREDQARALTERLEAAREAQRRRGKLYRKQSS